MSVAGKRNSEPKQLGRKCLLGILVSAETRTRAAEPANSGPFGSSQEISPNVDCVVADAARIEPISTSNSLLAGNLAGNFLKNGLRGRHSRLKRGQDQSLYEPTITSIRRIIVYPKDDHQD